MDGEISKRSVLKSLGIGSAGILSATTASAGGSSAVDLKKTKRAQQRFSTDERILEEAGDRISVLLDQLKTDELDDYEAVASVDSLVSIADVSIFVGTTAGSEEAITHVQLNPPDSGLEIIHQVEAGRTILDTKHREDTYVLTGLNEDVTTQKCFVSDTCCGGSKDCGKYDEYYYVYEDYCCCCGSNEGDCSLRKTSECCTEYDC